MENEKIYDLLEKMYIELKTGQTEIKAGLTGVEERVKKLEIKIEHDVESKLTALFDGQKQFNDKLDRIEQEVSKHEEIILRRVK